MRAAVIGACAPLIRDVVLTGLDLDFIGALIFPDLNACAALAGLPRDSDPGTVVAHPAVVAEFTVRLSALAGRATGSSNHVARALLLALPPRLDEGEVTDKGTINQRAVLAARAAEASAIYTEPPPATVLQFPRKDK